MLFSYDQSRILGKMSDHAVEKNDFKLSDLQKRYDKLRCSKSYIKLKNRLYEEMKVKHPERLRKIESESKHFRYIKESQNNQEQT